MKNVFTFCCALCLLALTACGSAPKISEEASDLEVNNHEGVTMTVVDGSAYPGQVKVTILYDANYWWLSKQLLETVLISSFR